MELVISVDEIQVLLNLLRDDLIRISYPFLDLPILEAVSEDASYRIKVLLDKKSLDRAYGIIRGAPSHVRGEVPHYRNFVECFIAASIINYSNLEEFKEKLDAYIKLEKGIAFAPDTNIFYHRFLSRIIEELPIEPTIVLVDTVKEEIERAMNDKLKVSQIKAMMEYFWNGELAIHLSNRRNLRSRVATYLAMREFEKLKQNIIEISSEGIYGKNGDEIIVKAIKRFDTKNPVLTVLLTADISLTDIANMEGVEYFLFDVPDEVPSSLTASPFQFRELIFNLAAVYGVIKLNDIIMLGEFGGKMNIEELKLIIADENTGKNLKKHVEICRKVSSLGIER